MYTEWISDITESNKCQSHHNEACLMYPLVFLLCNPNKGNLRAVIIVIPTLPRWGGISKTGHGLNREKKMRGLGIPALTHIYTTGHTSCFIKYNFNGNIKPDKTIELEAWCNSAYIIS